MVTKSIHSCVTVVIISRCCTTGVFVFAPNWLAQVYQDGTAPNCTLQRCPNWGVLCTSCLSGVYQCMYILRYGVSLKYMIYIMGTGYLVYQTGWAHICYPGVQVGTLHVFCQDAYSLWCNVHIYEVSGVPNWLGLGVHTVQRDAQLYTHHYRAAK